MLATRATQWQAFARWEAAQARESDGAQLDYARIQEAVDWYADALEFAERHGGAGGDAAEWHLQHLIAWVVLWRRAWGAPETSEPP